MRILLVEDQSELAGEIRRRMRRDGFAVDHVGSVGDALEALRAHSYAVAMLDRRLPDGDGLAIVPEIRRRQPGSRVLVLSALDAVDERINGLDAGADDYLTKPFDLDEMMARIRAALRRPGADSAPPIRVGALEFDLGTRAVAIDGRPAVFHHRELALLEGLVRRAGRVAEREALASEIWGFDEPVQSHALTIIVSRVRARLQKLEARVDIHMVRGVGYFLCETEE
ncbi:two-component system response regulator [Methylosinus sp. R-45379]|uniref:response regulator transcription factor n=1 Tax=unclassified Methylosinus TaxID=2624500 RepID=UPI0004673C2D|nr:MULTISPECIES: response regulator transcription factor [unclassified Methylosinus]OAI30656.1 two-component system response regulator [Methylosinus sp. R-45379]